MPDITSADEAVAALDAVAAFARDTYGAHHEGRLGQLDQALSTARMAVEHLADEEHREVDLARRIVAREKVHGGDPAHEVHSPISRDYSETLRIAGVH